MTCSSAARWARPPSASPSSPFQGSRRVPRKSAAASSDKPKRVTKPRRKKVDPGTRGLTATEVGAQSPADGAALAEAIRSDGGSPLAIYREPLGGHTVVLASL